MKFKYKNYGHGILRPVIPIEILHKNQTVPYEVLVDSGADFCIFNAQIGELLGIDIKSGEVATVGGITGVREYYFVHEVTIKVGGWPYKIKVGFLQNIARLGYGVVGQKGFFELFKVNFDYQNEEVEIKQRK